VEEAERRGGHAGRRRVARPLRPSTRARQQRVLNTGSGRANGRASTNQDGMMDAPVQTSGRDEDVMRT